MKKEILAGIAMTALAISTLSTPVYASRGEHGPKPKPTPTPTVTPTPTPTVTPTPTPTPVPVNGTLDQADLYNDGGTSARTMPGYKVWQSFTAGRTGTLTKIEMGMFTVINGTGTLEIFDGEGTNGTLLLSQPVSVLITDGLNTMVPFLVNLPVVAGHQYTFQFTPNTDMPDPYGVMIDSLGQYAGGQYAIVDPSVTSLDGWDMTFATYVK